MTEELKFSQEDLDRVVKDRLGREKVKFTEIADQLVVLQKDHNELEDKYGKVKDIAEEVPTLKRAKLVAEVAEELALPQRLVGRITGETREEIEADVKSLLADLEPLSSGDIPNVPGGQPAKPKLSRRESMLKEMGKINDEGRTHRTKVS